jgi:hypothetical protein
MILPYDFGICVNFLAICLWVIGAIYSGMLLDLKN